MIVEILTAARNICRAAFGILIWGDAVEDREPVHPLSVGLFLFGSALVLVGVIGLGLKLAAPSEQDPDPVVETGRCFGDQRWASGFCRYDVGDNVVCYVTGAGSISCVGIPVGSQD